MRKQTLAVAFGAALSTLVAVSAASAAQSASSFRCESQMTGAKTHPVVFHCDARTPQGTAYVRPADCDPATMSWGAMQAHCKAANAAQQTGG